jgi:hypothetical protein
VLAHCRWARAELTDRYWRTRSQTACMSIQSATRVWIARREFRAHVLEEVRRRKTAAVVVLQAFAVSNPVARRRPLIRSPLVLSPRSD